MMFKLKNPFAMQTLNFKVKSLQSLTWTTMWVVPSKDL